MTCKRGELQIPCAAALVMTAQAGRGLGKRHGEESRLDRPGDEIERKASGLGRRNREPLPEPQKLTFAAAAS